MTDLDLARRAIACRGWRWMPGMRWNVRRAAPLEDVAGRVTDAVRTLYPGWAPYPNALPDLADPATRGCLLALVREAWPGALVCVYPAHRGRPWEAEVEAPDDEQSRSFFGDTEAEALILALEAADAR